MRKGSEVGGQDRARLEGDEWKIFEMEKKKLSDRLEGEEIERWSLIPPSPAMNWRTRLIPPIAHTLFKRGLF